MARYLLSHDIGTSADKATLFTIDGRVAKTVLAPYSAHYFNQNWAEQNAMDWWRAFCRSNREILNGISPTDIAAVCVSGQMMGCLPVDVQANPLRNAIIWTDGRSIQETIQLQEKISADEFYRVAGIRPSPNFTIEKVMWLMNNEPQIYENTYCFLSSKDFINARLTGVFATDSSDAGYTNAFDFYNRRWSDIIFQATNVDQEKFPAILEPGTLLGGVLDQVAEEAGLAPGTPVVEGLGDGRAACIGAGVLEPGDAYICLGTSSWVSRISTNPKMDSQGRLEKASFSPGVYSDSGTMQAGGLSLNWMKNQLALWEQHQSKLSGSNVYSYIDQMVQKTSVGANGVIFLPYLMGERAPIWDMEAKGAFLGLKGENTRGDLFRSVMEGVALHLTTIYHILRDMSDDITNVRFVGGGSKSRVWQQIFADCFNMPITKTSITDEAGGLGTAVAAGVGVGIYSDLSIVKSFHQIEYIAEPKSENVQCYQEILPIFKDAYYALKDINHRLKEI